MRTKTIVLLLTLATAAGAGSTVDVQLGVTQFYVLDDGWDDGWDYDLRNKLGYAGGIRYELAFPNWAVELDVRCFAFPGPENSVAIYADVKTPFYFTDAPVRIYAAPGLGYDHTEKRITGYGSEPERSKHDFFRFPVAFGVKAVSGTKYLDIHYQIVPEIPTGDIANRYYAEVLDFYLEQLIEAEFGWAFAKHFGLTAKAGAVRGNYAVTSNVFEDTAPYVPFVEVGPSIYF